MDPREQLLIYECELLRLRTENARLRESAETFGALAERLNTALREIDARQPAGSSCRSIAGITRLAKSA